MRCIEKEYREAAFGLMPHIPVEDHEHAGPVRQWLPCKKQHYFFVRLQKKAATYHGGKAFSAIRYICIDSMPSWHSIKWEEAMDQLDSSLQGLSSSEAEKRLKEIGPNVLESPDKPSSLRIFVSQFKNYLILVLIFAASISYLAGEMTNTIVVLGIVLLVAVIGFLQEFKAERAMEALRSMVAPEAKVIRDGKRRSIPASELVPGDVIYLESGDKTPSDARIIEAASLEIIESALTGESEPVSKTPDPVAEDEPMAERKSMAFMGTIVTYGGGTAVVVATGKDTMLGRISGLIAPRSEDAPLKQKLEHLARRQAILVLAISSFIFVLGLWQGQPILVTLITAIALAVAGIPEALPFVVTLTLAFGTQAMARKNAIIRSLPAVETLGSTTVICTDKTGTLTTGETTVREILTSRRIEVTGSGYEPTGSFISSNAAVDASDLDLSTIIKIAVLCSNTDLEKIDGGWRVIGDPTEGSLIVAAAKAGVLQSIRSEFVEIIEFPFDSDRKRMTSVCRSDSEGIIAAVKGAPEVILDRCSSVIGSDGIHPLKDEDRERIMKSSDEMALRALRVLGLAWRPLSYEGPLERDFVEQNLIFAGLVGMMDPPRPEAKEAISTCIEAGIRPVMITGDHRLTARAIASELGIASDDVLEGCAIDAIGEKELSERVKSTSIFARVTAEHKVRIVRAFKNNGHIVAMTGDGVNDAPALKAADIGVAMGRGGTEVAKEASDMVITDDNFATIVGAVEEGRRIYDNIRKSASYLLSVSFAELAVIFLSSLVGLPAPLLALQILWINVVAEEFPAIGLSLEPATRGLMKRPPRDPKEPMPTRGLMIYTLAVSGLIVIGTLGLYTLALWDGQSVEYARTTAFVALGMLTICNAYSSRSLDISIIRLNPMDNIVLIAGMLCSLLAILAAVYLPFFQGAFETVPLRSDDWAKILAASVSIMLAIEVMKKALRGFRFVVNVRCPPGSPPSGLM
jgi:Ca2+-transporting ATPase